MLDITTIILTYNEELHIARCLNNVLRVSKKVYVIDSPSTDKTQEICKQYSNVEVVVHTYPGNQAEQFNWALDNIDVNTKWVLRLDADEYLTDELICEIEKNIPSISDDISAIVLPLGVKFLGKSMNFGANGVKIIRLFRLGKAKYGNSLMDEHLIVEEGQTVEFKNKFIDDNLNGLRFFIDKHNGYSTREAYQLLDAEFGIEDMDNFTDMSYCEDVRHKKAQKRKYAKLPLFWRSFGYFCYRYFFKLGFMNGTEGFLRDFFQGLWYRMLVDAKVYEVKKKCGSDKQKIKAYFESNYNFRKQ